MPKAKIIIEIDTDVMTLPSATDDNGIEVDIPEPQIKKFQEDILENIIEDIKTLIEDYDEGEELGNIYKGNTYYKVLNQQLIYEDPSDVDVDDWGVFNVKIEK